MKDRRFMAVSSLMSFDFYGGTARPKGVAEPATFVGVVPQRENIKPRFAHIGWKTTMLRQRNGAPPNF